MKHTLRIRKWLAEWTDPYKRYRHQRVIHTVRLAAAVVAASLVAYLLNLRHGEWIAMTVFVLLGTVPYQGAITSKAYERIIGTVLGMGAGLALLWLNHNYLHYSPQFFLLLGIAAAASGWLSLGRHGYAAMLAGLTMCMLLGGTGSHWIQDGVMRAVNVVIGALIVLLASMLIPIKSTLMWRFSLADNMEACARLFSIITAHKTIPEDAVETLWAEQRDMSARLVKTRAMMPAAAHETKIGADVLESIQQSQRNIISSVNLMLAGVSKLPKPRLSPDEEKLISSHFAALRHDLHLTAMLLKGRWRPRITISFAQEEAVRTLAAKLPFETQGFLWTSLTLRAELAYLLAVLQPQRKRWLTLRERVRLR